MGKSPNFCNVIRGDFNMDELNFVYRGLLALRVTLRLQEDKPSTHQNVCGGRFMSGGQMDKAWYKNVLTQKLDKQCIRK
jgi:hypothetical protein